MWPCGCLLWSVDLTPKMPTYQKPQDALKAAAERKRKERQAILNPPPDKKKWRKQQQMAGAGAGGGQQGPARWQPSSDLQARRNPRRGG